MKNNRYADGYLPKIAYHMFKCDFDKMNHFMERQRNTYGKLTPDNLKRIVELHNELEMG